MISAVVHTYNEEKNIGRCLSPLSFVDEIVVIDMGSTDKTLEIVKEYTGNIHFHPYTGFVEPARNFGLKKAKGDWILVVDADEEIPQTLGAYLVKESNMHSADFFRLPRKNVIFNRWIRHTGWWPDYQVRFFVKGTVEWVEHIHGVPSTKGNGSDIHATEQLSIIHNHYQSVEQYVSRFNRYTSITAKELFLANERFSLPFLFARAMREFTTRYFAWAGYKDGLHGLALSLLQACSEIVACLKLWELEGFKQKNVPLADVEKFEHMWHREMRFWISNGEMEKKKTAIEKFLFKIKRKLHAYA